VNEWPQNPVLLVVLIVLAHELMHAAARAGSATYHWLKRRVSR
jgi:hypothetical protein